jgi:membrane peptidoglycan carboxypeptidase
MRTINRADHHHQRAHSTNTGQLRDHCREKQLAQLQDTAFRYTRVHEGKVQARVGGCSGNTEEAFLDFNNAVETAVTVGSLRRAERL